MVFTYVDPVVRSIEDNELIFFAVLVIICGLIKMFTAVHLTIIFDFCTELTKDGCKKMMRKFPGRNWKLRSLSKLTHTSGCTEIKT